MAPTMLDEKWYQRVWLPFAAATYIIICIFDFMIMPVYVTSHNSRIENAVFAKLDGKDAAEFADGLMKANQAQRQWNPLTLIGGGLFHVAFGALLTGGAVTRGFAKKSEIENYRYGGYYERQQDYPSNSGHTPYNPSRNAGSGTRDDYADSGPTPKAY